MADAVSSRIIVAGGGFSGLCVIAELVRRAAEGGISILWHDERGHFGKGIAYGKDYPHYLLNVRADRMGLFAEAPEGFYAWLQSERGLGENRLYPIGPLLAGVDLKTTAVPEIRKTAALLARRILGRG